MRRVEEETKNQDAVVHMQGKRQRVESVRGFILMNKVWEEKE